MLLRTLETLKPDYMVVAFDLPQPTFRMQMYTPYQGKRPEMQGNLVEQIPLVHELLEAAKIAHFEVEGFEADDVIGTLAKQAAEQKSTETIILTGDRDMLQLVNSHVKVQVPVKGLAETKTYDEETVEKEFGVKPAQWVDVKALKGDSSDNYPGVRGIGPKTAEKLIREFNNLENLYLNLGKVEAKIAKKLAEGTESAGMSKKLATIMTSVPGVYLDWEKAKVSGINWTGGVGYMREVLGFRSIPEKIEKQYLRSNKKDPDTKLQSNKTNKESREEQMRLI